jgi:hypothetical protein
MNSIKAISEETPRNASYGSRALNQVFVFPTLSSSNHPKEE